MKICTHKNMKFSLGTGGDTVPSTEGVKNKQYEKSMKNEILASKC